MNVTETAVAGRLSMLDRFLPVWIGAAMVVGLLLGRSVPGVGNALAAVELDGISLPIALGLLIMMYPVLAKVRYDRLDSVTADRRLLLGSLALNWIIGPALMYVDDEDIVYIPEHNGGMVSVLNLEGERLAQWGDIKYRSCHGIWVDSHKDLYVVTPGDWGKGRRVVKYSRKG